MRDWQIRVAPFEFVSITGVYISREVDEHGKAVVEGYIESALEDRYNRLLHSDVWASVQAFDENDDKRTLLTGIVTSFTMDHKSHFTFMKLEIMTGTFLMDTRFHFRSFQNENATFSQLLDIINGSYHSSGVVASAAADAPTGQFLLQFEETDWAFAKRLGSINRSSITPCFDREGVKFFFGMRERDAYTITDNLPFIAEKRIDDFAVKAANGAGLSEIDCMTIQFEHREIYQIWDRITLHKIPLYVRKIETNLVGQELLHTYWLCTQAGMNPAVRTYNLPQGGCSFEAYVTDVRKDIVQVSFVGDENADQQVTKWFKYSTVYSSPDGTGWYCMPEIGDLLRIHIPSKLENHGYAISSVHMDHSSSRQDPDRKSIKTKYGKEIFFTPDSIVLTNNNGMRIEILDKQGINILSDKKIRIESADNLTISSEKASMTIAATQDMTLQQSNTSIRLDDNITFAGGKFRIQ